MATFTTFEEIGARQKARQLTREIYKITSGGAFARDYDLRNQIRRAAVSVMSNIAEGFERSGTGEFNQFLATAKGSAGEIRSQLYVALDQNYLSEATFGQLRDQATEVGRMIGGLMTYLKKSGIKGTKYKKAV
ncbi:MAG TPA: four helix bundle protein [Pyrinomonadaceae bacterium]|nr:four helix bundle protein [Pyrinomonadaceae bacterium]